MKIVLAGVAMAVIVAAAGYFALPVLIERKTAGIGDDLKALRQRVEKVEGFVRAEEEARQTVQIKAGADAAAVVRGVNALATRLASLEGSFRKEMDTAAAALKEQKSSTAAALKKQAETLEKESGEIRARLRDISYKALLADVREHLLKVKTDLLAKNVGTADAEMELTVALLEKAKSGVAPEALKWLEAAQATLRKARGEMTTDLPAAMKRVDLLWHEMGKVNGVP